MEHAQGAACAALVWLPARVNFPGGTAVLERVATLRAAGLMGPQ